MPELEYVTSRPRPTAEDEEDGSALIQSLPPTDSGREAWKYLLGCFIVEALLWGFPLSFGVFQEYYSRQPQFAGSASNNIAVIGTTSTSVYFLGAPLAAPLTKRFQAWQRSAIAVGWCVCALSLLGASFASSIPALIALQGVLYGFGFLILYFFVLNMLNEWFVKRRGLAYGVLYAGGGFTGVGLPFALERLLATTGYRTTLRIVAGAQLACLIPTMFLLKPRLPPSHATATRVVDWSFFRKPLFWVFCLSNLAQSFAYYIPGLYLPSYASVIGLSGTMGALILAANNLACIIGQVGFGYLSDRLGNVHILLFVSTFVSSVAAFTIWGFARSLEALLMFSLVYGWFAGAYVVFWPKFGSLLSEDPQPVYSLMAFGKGIGNIVTSPIAASLLTKPVQAGYGMGKFEPLIIFLGSLMLCSSFGIVGWPLKGRIARA